MNLRRLALAYAISNAILYSGLLPLWEGFDEPFHFGYVQELANGRGLPDPRSMRLSQEVTASIALAPGSEVVKRNLPEIVTYADYFSWPDAKRAQVHAKLYQIHPDLRWQPSQRMNYEAQQAPLAYALMALPERLLARIPIPNRVLILRVIFGMAGAILLYFGAERLFSQLAIDEPYKSAAIFCLFSCQMTWGTLAHVANDWLAAPVAVWLLALLISYAKIPSRRNAALISICLCIGLLTKEYFIAFVPLVLTVSILTGKWRRLVAIVVIVVGLAGPWYGRNLIRYGAITGTQESQAGVGLKAAVHAMPSLHWPAVIYSTVHGVLWTGNNTFFSFSANTLNLVIVVWLAALILWTLSRHDRREWITLAYCAIFIVALGYATAVGYVYTKGAVLNPSAWYTQLLLAPLLGLGFLGASRWKRLGSILASILVLLFGYVLMPTYLWRLIPIYGGYRERTSLAGVIKLYIERGDILAANLNSAALAPIGLIFTMTAMVVVLAVIQQIVLIRSFYRPLWKGL